MNREIMAIGQSASVAIADKVRRMIAAGVDVVPLQTGDPDFSTPEPIVTAAHQAILSGRTHYTHSRGIPQLREAISRELHKRLGVTFDSETEILITHGGIHAYFCALAAVCEPGDEVIVPDPAWIPHFSAVRLIGCKPVMVPPDQYHSFFPSIQALRAAVTRRTKAILINSPHNPTGSVASEKYIKAIVALAESQDLVLISDEVYHPMVYGVRKHHSPLKFDRGRTRVLLINSFSKTYAMSGWRIGYLVGPESIIRQALKVSQFTITNLAPFVQHAAFCALTDENVQIHVEKMVRAYEQRWRAAMEILQPVNGSLIRLSPPQGAFYLFPDISPTGLTDLEVAQRLLDEAHVAVVPGSVYGSGGKGFIRLTVAVNQQRLCEGARRIVRWLNNLP